MSAQAEGSDQALHRVIDQALSAEPPTLSDTARTALPPLNDWLKHKDAAERALLGVPRLPRGQSLNTRAERILAPALWSDETALDRVPSVANSLQSRLAGLADVPRHVIGHDAPSVGDVFAQITFAARITPMAEVGMLSVLNPDSSESRRLKGDQRQLADKARLLEEARAKTSLWSQKLSPEETQTGLRLAQAKEGKLLSFLSGDWRRLRKLVEAHTDTSEKAIKPTVTDLLRDLDAEHIAAANHAEAARQIALRHGFEDYESLQNLLAERATGRMAEGPAVDPILTALATDSAEAERKTLALAQFAGVLSGITQEAEGVIDDLEALPWSELTPTLQALSASGPHLQDLKFLLAPLSHAPASIWTCLRALNLSAVELDAAILHETVRRSLIKTPGLAAIGADTLSYARAKIAMSKKELQRINAQLLEGRAIERFGEKIALTAEMDRNLSSADRARKASFAKARRALEHEFKKVRAYRSPREMLDGPAGALLPEIKPIWLMSPLSVADVLPLESDLFDVVIFDEASQIPVEDAVPTLLRAPQIIVVGDEKQLPPSKFFGATNAEESFDDDADEDDLDFELTQDSFLTLAAERLSSSMLNWHYRSRSEELIGFSNQAFYQGRLLTIPSVNRTRQRPEIRVSDVQFPPHTVPEILSRPISYHVIEEGVYALRRNPSDATYIAHLLCNILAQENGKSIGIIAFSEAQQSEIESALTRLAASDPAFSKCLDAEFEREEDGEFTGLFVKNLENVQGDERDIILLSICYAPAANGKMRMNFGPINKMGGEKRLNVIFSRAKENMIVVSSIKSVEITNEYNQGANALKTFLKYAEMMSIGDQAAARLALNTISTRRIEAQSLPSTAVERMAEALKERGFWVETKVGLSAFEIDIALRREDNSDFKLAILLDTPQTYQRSETHEILTDRAGLLQVFGWHVLSIPTKDWWSDPSAVLDHITTHFANIESPRHSIVSE